MSGNVSLPICLKGQIKSLSLLDQLFMLIFDIITNFKKYRILALPSHKSPGVGSAHLLN